MAEKNEYTGYYPKAGDELKFYLKHLIKLVKKSKPAENEVQFKGGTKTIDRKKDRHGYMPGEDRKVYEAEISEDEYRKKKMQGKDWHSKPADTSHMSLSGKRLKNAVKAHVDEYKNNPEEYARKMSEEKIEEGDVVSLDKARQEKSGHPKYVMHKGAKHEVLKVHPAESHKDETHYTLRKVHVQRGSSHSWPQKVPKSQTKALHVKEELKSLTDILGESVSDLILTEAKLKDRATQAFLNREKFKRTNTHVYKHEDGTHRLRLHNTDVAKLHPNGKVEVTTGGWNTKTTVHGRLNPIADAVGAKRFSVKGGELHHGGKPVTSDWVTLRDNK